MKIIPFFIIFRHIKTCPQSSIGCKKFFFKIFSCFPKHIKVIPYFLILLTHFILKLRIFCRNHIFILFIFQIQIFKDFLNTTVINYLVNHIIVIFYQIINRNDPIFKISCPKHNFQKLHNPVSQVISTKILVPVFKARSYIQII